MATQKQTVQFLLEKLRQPKRFSARAMFGEYALYADDTDEPPRMVAGETQRQRRAPRPL